MPQVGSVSWRHKRSVLLIAMLPFTATSRPDLGTTNPLGYYSHMELMGTFNPMATSLKKLSHHFAWFIQGVSRDEVFAERKEGHMHPYGTGNIPKYKPSIYTAGADTFPGGGLRSYFHYNHGKKSIDMLSSYKTSFQEGLAGKWSGNLISLKKCVFLKTEFIEILLIWQNIVSEESTRKRILIIL